MYSGNTTEGISNLNTAVNDVLTSVEGFIMTQSLLDTVRPEGAQEAAVWKAPLLKNKAGTLIVYVEWALYN